MADWIPVDALLAEEAELQFDGFTNEDAWTLGTVLVAAARERQLPVTIDLRRGEQQLFHYACDGTSADNDRWVERKVAVVRRFGHSSLWVGQTARERGQSPYEIFALDPAAYAAHGGAFPLNVRGVGLVGVVTVSGLPQLDDHAFVVQGLREFLRR